MFSPNEPQKNIIRDHDHLLNQSRSTIYSLAAPGNVVLVLDVRDPEATAVADRILPGSALMVKQSIQLTAIPTIITHVPIAEACALFPKLEADLRGPVPPTGRLVVVAGSGVAEALVIAFVEDKPSKPKTTTGSREAARRVRQAARKGGK